MKKGSVFSGSLQLIFFLSPLVISFIIIGLFDTFMSLCPTWNTASFLLKFTLFPLKKCLQPSDLPSGSCRGFQGEPWCILWLLPPNPYSSSLLEVEGQQRRVSYSSKDMRGDFFFILNRRWFHAHLSSLWLEGWSECLIPAALGKEQHPAELLLWLSEDKTQLTILEKLWVTVVC